MTANVSIEFTAPDATAAMNQASVRQQAVIDALAGSGIDQADISTTNVTLQPQFGGGDNPTITGYQANNSIAVKIRRLDAASQTLALIGTTGGDATRINSVSYSIEDDSQMVRDARTRAFDDAKDRAEQYAQLSGMTLGDVISISESAGTTPPSTPADADAESGHGSRAARAGTAERRVLGDGDLGADLTGRCDVHRYAVEHRRARQRIELRAVVELVDVDAGLTGGHLELDAAAVMPPAVR